MIIEPNITDLMKKDNFDSRYTLVVAAAKRAREIANDDPGVDKAVKAAVKEIAEGKVHVVAAKSVEDEGEASYEELASILGGESAGE